MRSIYGQQLFHSLRAHHHRSDQIKIMKDQSAQTTTRVVRVVCVYIYIYIYIYIFMNIYIYIKEWLVTEEGNTPRYFNFNDVM